MAPYSPKYCSILWKFWPEVVSSKINTVWKILQIFAFWLKWDAPNVYSFGPFWGPIYCWKTKNITKNQKKPASLGISNDLSFRSQNNHRILVKLSKKNEFFWSKLGLNCPLEPNQQVNRNSHIAYNRTIHLYFLDAKFHLVGICCPELNQKETATFFLIQDPIWFRPILAHFLEKSNFYRDRMNPKFESLKIVKIGQSKYIPE